MLYFPNVNLFHFANEWTTSALWSFRSKIGKLTALSVPFNSSFIPKPFNTNKGAVALLKWSSAAKFCWKKSLIILIPFSVWKLSNN